MVSHSDVMLAFPLRNMEEDLNLACFTYDIWLRLILCLEAVVAKKMKVNEPFHLMSIKELKEVRNKYDHILWGEEGGYCEEGGDENYECEMESGVDCCTLKDIMHELVV